MMCAFMPRARPSPKALGVTPGAWTGADVNRATALRARWSSSATADRSRELSPHTLLPQQCSAACDDSPLDAVERPLLGSKHRSWEEGGQCKLPDFAWNDWAKAKAVDRVLDLMDINYLRQARPLQMCTRSSTRPCVSIGIAAPSSRIGASWHSCMRARWPHATSSTSALRNGRSLTRGYSWVL